MSVEMTIMLAFLVAVAVTVSTAFRDNDVFANLVSGPWQALAGLIQNGVWGTPESTMSQHPAQYTRFSSVEGDPIQ